MTTPETPSSLDPAGQTTVPPSGDRGDPSWSVPNLLREVGTILLAIVLAFWLDAWWDDRGAQIELDRQLDAIELELEQALAQADLTSQEEYIRRPERFLLLEEESVSALDVESAAALLFMGTWTFDANLSTLRAVAPSSVLAGRYPEIVPVLLNIATRVDDLAEDAVAVGTRLGICHTRLTELGVFADAWYHLRGYPEDASLSPQQIIERGFRDPEYRGCVAAYHNRLGNYRAEVGEVRTEVLEAQGLMERLRRG